MLVLIEAACGLWGRAHRSSTTRGQGIIGGNASGVPNPRLRRTPHARRAPCTDSGHPTQPYESNLVWCWTNARITGDVDSIREMQLPYPEETAEQCSGYRCDEMRSPRAPHWRKQTGRKRARALLAMISNRGLRRASRRLAGRVPCPYARIQLENTDRRTP
jgi:hypothetical protein